MSKVLERINNDLKKKLEDKSRAEQEQIKLGALSFMIDEAVGKIEPLLQDILKELKALNNK